MYHMNKFSCTLQTKVSHLCCRRPSVCDRSWSVESLYTRRRTLFWRQWTQLRPEWVNMVIAYACLDFPCFFPRLAAPIWEITCQGRGVASGIASMTRHNSEQSRLPSHRFPSIEEEKNEIGVTKLPPENPATTGSVFACRIFLHPEDNIDFPKQLCSLDFSYINAAVFWRPLCYLCVVLKRRLDWVLGSFSPTSGKLVAVYGWNTINIHDERTKPSPPRRNFISFVNVNMTAIRGFI